MNLTVNVPTTLNDITLGDYQRFASMKGDEEFIEIKAVEIFLKVDSRTALKMKVKDRRGLVDRLNAVLNEKPKFAQRFTLDSTEFGMIPNLDEMSFGEFTDLDTYALDVENLHRTLAVLYRPITKRQGDRYDIEPYESAEKYADKMKSAPLGVAQGAVAFFFDLGMDLLTDILNYSLRTATALSTSENSPKNGDGSDQFTDLQRATFDVLAMLRKSLSERLLFGSPTKSTPQS